MVFLDNNFIRTVSSRLEDCSSANQIRSCLNRYKFYMFSDDVKRVFKDRIDTLVSYHSGDKELKTSCEDILEDIEFESMISSSCRNSLTVNDELYKELINFSNFINNTSEEKAALIKIFEYFNGNKLDICRYLETCNSDLNNKVIQYSLKEQLNDIRRNYRNQVK